MGFAFALPILREGVCRMGRAKAKPITRETSTPRGARREAGLHSLYEPGASVRVVVEVEIGLDQFGFRSEEHTSELQSLMRHSYAVFCLKKKQNTSSIQTSHKS